MEDGNLQECDKLRARIKSIEADLLARDLAIEEARKALEEPLRRMCDLAAQLGADVIRNESASGWLKRECITMDMALRSLPSTERSLAVLAQNEAAKSLADLVVGEDKCWDAMEHRKRIDQYEGAKANVEAIDRVARLKETRP